MKNEHLEKYFEGINLFKKTNMTVKQFLYLLGGTVGGLTIDDSRCFACSIIDKAEKREIFVMESPKFNLQNLKKVWNWIVENKLTGSNDPKKPCSDVRSLIADLAINKKTEKAFLKWLPDYY